MYAFGEGPREIARLEQQAILFREISRRFFKAALRPGWRVLDLGSGTGALTFLAAELVGREGSVKGLDVSRLAIERARLRASFEGRTNVEFEEGDLEWIRDFDGFDAIIGRFVLSYLSAPEKLVERLVSGKTVQCLAFQEWLLTEELLCFPRTPSLATFRHLVRAALQSSGVHVDMALRVWSTLAGLRGWTVSRPEIVSVAFRGNEDPRIIDYLLSTAGALEGAMIDRGLISGAAEAHRLWRDARADLERRENVMLLDPVIGVWAERESFEA